MARKIIRPTAPDLIIPHRRRMMAPTFYIAGNERFQGAVVGVPAAIYTGPGDIVSGAIAWWGLRAYSAAQAGTKSVRIVRASDSAQQDFNTLANGDIDLTSITTFLNATTGKIVTLYDQTGNSLDVTQSTDANRPKWTFNATGSHPGITTDATTQQLVSSVNAPVTASPVSVSAVANRNGNTSSNGITFVVQGTLPLQAGYSAGGDAVAMYNGGNFLTAAALDNTFHRIQYVFNNASSSFYVDGVDSGTVNLNSSEGLEAAPIQLIGQSGYEALFLELGVWGTAFSSGQKSSLDTNQHAYWGV